MSLQPRSSLAAPTWDEPLPTLAALPKSPVGEQCVATAACLLLQESQHQLSLPSPGQAKIMKSYVNNQNIC